MKRSLLVFSVLVMTQSMVFAATSSVRGKADGIRSEMVGRIDNFETLASGLREGKGMTKATADKLAKQMDSALDSIIAAKSQAKVDVGMLGGANTKNLLKVAPHTVTAVSFILAVRDKGNNATATEIEHANRLERLIDKAGSNVGMNSTVAEVRALDKIMELAGSEKLAIKLKPFLEEVTRIMESPSKDVAQAMRDAITKLKPTENIEEYLKKLIDCENA